MEAPLPVHVTVVIPTRNEEEAIVDTIQSVPNDGWCQKLDFLVIDGNSEDRTRELAEEIRNVLDPLAWSYSKLKVLSIYGGSPYGRQIRALEKGVEIIVACPGRLLDLIERGALALDEIDI